VSAADRAIRVSTAVAVLGVAGIAAYVSYWHAYEVVRAHGESGVTARLEPTTIDGLVYASSMVVLYAARHRLAVPALARWLLALGIVATLAANVAHGWPNGPIGAAVAAWPAASLVGSYELLLWLIRTTTGSALTREPVGDEAPDPDVHPVTELRLALVPDRDAAGQQGISGDHSMNAGTDGPGAEVAADVVRSSGPDWPDTGLPYRPADQEATGWPAVAEADAVREINQQEVNGAAVAAYRASVAGGNPLSERKLAAMFGRTSRRWARKRMADARQNPDAVATTGW
jgi:hypothetical protein